MVCLITVISEYWIGKDMEGPSLSYMLGGTEENHEKHHGPEADVFCWIQPLIIPFNHANGVF
jgi:hypothetical protein